MTPEQRSALADRVLARSRADATEVTVEASHRALTRFTHESVNQNVDEVDVSVRVRALVDGRTGIATTNAFDDGSLDAVTARAHELATLAPREAIPPALAGAATATTPPGAYVEATASATPEARARIAAAIFDHAPRNDLWSSGFVTTAGSGLTIVTSTGARMTFDGSDAGANVKMSGRDATGFAERYAHDVATLDGSAIGARAARKAVAARAPIPVDPGEWTVILEPAAFGELLRYLTMHFSAESYGEGSSFFSGKLGTTVLGENVTIRDDYAHPLNPGMPFDYEAVPTERLALVASGVAENILTDMTWAKRLDRRSTGHAAQAPSSWGPQSNFTVVEPGAKSIEQLIAETPRGLLVTRLWYVRIVDQRTALLTGMTRDGTFLIENGKVTRGVRNMRFNESIVEALKTCEFASVQERTGGYGYSLVTPPVKLERFRFASASPY